MRNATMTTDHDTTPAIELAPRGRRGDGVRRRAGALVGAGAVAAAATFGFVKTTDNAELGGAADPDDLGASLVDAINDEDVLGMLDLLAPNERETLADPFLEGWSELQRLEVLDDASGLDDLSGLDIQIDPETVDVVVEPTSANDIVLLYSSFDGVASLNGEALPVGDLIRERFGVTDEDLAELTTTNEQLGPVDLPMAAVQVGGRWYLSVFYSVALAGFGTEIPETPVELRGADSPEAAVEQFFGDLADLDLEAVIGDLNPVEFEALQRLAPGFLDDLEDEMGDLRNVRITLDELSTSATGTGNERAVRINSFAVTIDADGQRGTVAVSPDGCVQVDVEDETSFETCASDYDVDELIEEAFADPTDILTFLDTARAAFEDYRNPYLTVRKVGGKWYVSPMATMANHPLAVLRALTRGEIEDLIDAGEDAVYSATAQFDNGEVQVPPSLIDELCSMMETNDRTDPENRGSDPSMTGQECESYFDDLDPDALLPTDQDVTWPEPDATEERATDGDKPNPVVTVAPEDEGADKPDPVVSVPSDDQ